jgi:Holliday junction resolvase
MATTPEAKVKAKVVKLLKERGVYYFFPATFGMGRSGVPDIVCCVRGRFLAIECKAGKNKPTALQEREIEAIRVAGGTALIINEDNIDTVRTIIEEITR